MKSPAPYFSENSYGKAKNMKPFDKFRKELRKTEPQASFQRMAEFDNGTGLQAVYHHWSHKKHTMILFLVFEESGEFNSFEPFRSESLTESL